MDKCMFGIIFSFLLYGRVWCGEVPCYASCILCTETVSQCHASPNVTELNLSGSAIHTVEPGAFNNLTNLLSLDLSNNMLTALDSKAFTSLGNCKYLNLSNNGLKNISNELFIPLTKLETLDISNNEIDSITMNMVSSLGMLKTLYINSNQISALLQGVLTALPSLVEILLKCGFQKPLMKKFPSKLSGNPWKCDCNITTVYELLTSQSINITTLDKNLVTCSTPSEHENIMVSSLDLFTDPSCYSVPSIVSSLPISLSTLLLSPSPSLFSSSISVIPYSSTPSTKLTISSTKPTTSSPLTSSPQPSTTLHHVSSSSQMPLPTNIIVCSRDTTVSEVGKIFWNDTTVGKTALVACPYGPINATASRQCSFSADKIGLWGDVEHGDCNLGSVKLYTVQEITKDNAQNISNFILSLPIMYFNDSDISILVNLSSQLVQATPTDTVVLHNVLSVADLIIADNITLSHDTVSRIQNLVNRALINAVNSENPEIILNFTHLLTGARYIDRDSIFVYYNTKLEFKNGSIDLSSKITITYEGIQSLDIIQVTIYNHSSNEVYPDECTKIIDNHFVCDSTVMSPVAVLISNHSNINIPAIVTFNSIMIKLNYVGICGFWNATLFGKDKGGWDTTTCNTSQINATYICNCSSYDDGIAILEIPAALPSASETTYDPTDTVILPTTEIVPPTTEIVPTSSITDSPTVTVPPNSTLITPLPILLALYVGGGIGILLHIPVTFASVIVCFRYDFVRNIQALLFHSIAQISAFISIVVSYERTEINEVCLSLGSLLHYFILVTMMWFMFRPIVLILSQTNRLLYEKDCFILPFIFMAWALPIIPVAIYGILTVSSFEGEITNCWLEGISFPNYFTYLSPICFIIVTVLVIGTGVVLLLSDYSVPGSTYIQLVDIFIEAVLFCITIGFQFTTANVSQHSNTLVVVTAGSIIFSGLYYIIANVFCRSKLRKGIICSFEKNYSRGRPFVGQDTPTTRSTVSSTKSSKLLYRDRRQPKLQHGMNLDYIGGYLGYPFEVWSEVGDGQRVRRKKNFSLKENPYSSSEV